jgi:lysophospholipase L1-like esterase
MSVPQSSLGTPPGIDDDQGSGGRRREQDGSVEIGVPREPGGARSPAAWPIGTWTIGGLTALGMAAVGLAAALAAAGWAGLLRQARAAATTIEAAAVTAALADGTLPSGAGLAREAIPPRADGIHLPDGTGPSADARHRLSALRLAMVGDSTSIGYGCATADEVPGVVLARGAATTLRRPVELRSIGVVGTGSADLARQVDQVLAGRFDVAVVVTGANDITSRVPPWRSAARLGEAVARLRAAGVSVVVGTCPDLGVIAPIRQPLRAVVGAWSRRLAVLQARASSGAGGRVVMIGRLVSPEFRGRPDLFYADGFHPSGPGYARAAAALLPEVMTALGSRSDAV